MKLDETRHTSCITGVVELLASSQACLKDKPPHTPGSHVPFS